jgi:large subunit ribosomal protein L25
MKHLQLETQDRTILGNRVRKLRREGLVPAVIYGKDYPSKTVQLPLNTFLKTYRQTGRTGIIDIKIGNENIVVPCLVADTDLDPVKETVRHVNFLAIDLKAKIDTLVPVKLIGLSPAVKEYGAILIQNLHEVEIRVLPEKIPSEIEVDISILKDLDNVIHADAIKSDEYEVLTHPEETIVSLSVVKDIPESESEIVTEVETGQKETASEVSETKSE